jgi:hypothetical protein
MPQPAAAPASPEAGHRPGSPEWLVAQARDLENQRAVLMKKIGKNRESLRNLDELDALSAEHQKFVREFYPLKEKGERRSKEDIERTRKAREAARSAA